MRTLLVFETKYPEKIRIEREAAGNEILPRDGERVTIVSPTETIAGTVESVSHVYFALSPEVLHGEAPEHEIRINIQSL